jgi:hypothetical protein
VLQEKVDAENAKTTKLSEQERTTEALNDTMLSLQAQVTILQQEYNDNIPVYDNNKPKKSLYRTLHKFYTGKGKWKKVTGLLFGIEALHNLLIDETVGHLRDNVYTKKGWAYTVDMRSGVNINSIDSCRNIEFGPKNSHKLIWSSGWVKSVHRQIEKDMSQELSFSVIKERHHDLMVDGVSFDIRALFAYLITSFGLEKSATEGTLEIYVTVDGAKLDERTQHVTIGFKICDNRAKDPVTGKFIYCNDDGEGDESHLDNLQ